MTAWRRPRFLLALLAAHAGCGSGADDRSPQRVWASKIGSVCKVQFRRDALGTASPSPVSPMTDNHNGTQISMTGVLRSVQDDWLVFHVTSEHNTLNGKSLVEEIWVPKQSVLLIKWSEPPSK